MSIDIECPHCGGELSVEKDLFGVPFDCPVCGDEILVETDEEESKPRRRRKTRLRQSSKQLSRQLPPGRTRSRQTTAGAPQKKKKGRPVLMTCGILMLIGFALVGCIGLVFFLAWRKDSSLREYAKAKIAAKQFPTEADREMAFALADKHHDEVRSLTQNENSMSGFFAIRQSEYYDLMNDVIESRLKRMRPPVAVTAANVVGLWTMEGRYHWYFYDCRKDGSYNGGFIFKENGKTPVKTAGTWSVQSQTITWKDAEGTDPDPIVRLGTNDLVVREFDGSLTFFHRADDLETAMYERHLKFRK